jgi:NAD(P)-dependent dehydrogenase (short-subunit alcohol dehydrogenase family)
MFQRLNNLNGKVAVITGGCGQVGYATAQRLSQQGATVIALVRKDIDSAMQKMQALSGTAILADITNSADLTSAAAMIKEQFGRCDILVNSASITKNVLPSNLDALTDDMFDSIVATNLRGVFATIRAFAPMLKETKDGLIVNISSTSAEGASNSNIAYGCSKAGINQLTKTLAKALAPEIRIVAESPGFMVEPTSGAVKGPGANEKMAESSPLKRIGYADDIASTIEACCTHIRFATGSVFLVDGGRTV